MDYTIIGGVVAALSVVLGLLATIIKITRDIRKEREEENAKTLQQAKDFILIEVQNIKSEIINLENIIKNTEKSIDRDIEHVRETYNSEIKNLSDKVEQLREQITKSHSELISLISKMVQRD